jgi:hypothetical protein
LNGIGHPSEQVSAPRDITDAGDNLWCFIHVYETNNVTLYLGYSTLAAAEGQSEQRQTQGAKRGCKKPGEKPIKIHKDFGC